MKDIIVCEECKYEKIVYGIYFCVKYNKPTEGSLLFKDGKLITCNNKPNFL